MSTFYFQPLVQQDPGTARRQQLAQMLMQRGTSGQAGHPYDVFANMLNAYTGAKMMGEADQATQARQKGVRDTLAKAMSAYQGGQYNIPEGGVTEAEFMAMQPSTGGRQALVDVMMSNPDTAGMASTMQLQQAFTPTEYQTATVGVKGDPSQRQTVVYPKGDPSKVSPLGAPYTPKAATEINMGGQPVQEADDEAKRNRKISEQVGAPLAIRSPWSGISDPKKRDEAKIKYGMDADKKLDALSTKAEQYASVVDSIDRFLFLNEKNYTGKAMAVPGTKFARSLMDPEFEEMQSISDKLTPAMRQGMPGAASDRDVAMFRGATLGVEKSPDANKNIGLALKTSKQNVLDMISFMKDFKLVNQHLEGAETLWKQYLEANPIFDPAAEPGSYTLNENRMSYKRYFMLPQFFSPNDPIYQSMPADSLYRDENGTVRHKQ